MEWFIHVIIDLLNIMIMNEDKKEFLFLSEEDRKQLGEGRIVFMNCVAPNATQVVVVSTDASMLESVLDKVHRLWPAGNAQGRKQEASQGAGQATGPEDHPAEDLVCGLADGVLDAYQKGSLVCLLGVFRSILMDDYHEQEIYHDLLNITKVKNVDSFLNQVQQLYVRHFRKYPLRLELFLKRTVLCAFIGLVPNKVSKQRPEELEGVSEVSQAGEPGQVKDKRAPRKGSGFSPSNIRRKLLDCLTHACHE